MIEKWSIINRSLNDPRWWFMGHFINKDDFFHSDEIELKYATGKKGDTSIGSTTQYPRKTLTILISWKIEMYFPESDKTIILDTPFDYIADSSIPGAHTTKVLEDCVILWIRTPSQPIN